MGKNTACLVLSLVLICVYSSSTSKSRDMQWQIQRWVNQTSDFYAKEMNLENKTTGLCKNPKYNAIDICLPAQSAHCIANRSACAIQSYLPRLTNVTDTLGAGEDLQEVLQQLQEQFGSWISEVNCTQYVKDHNVWIPNHNYNMKRMGFCVLEKAKQWVNQWSLENPFLN